MKKPLFNRKNYLPKKGVSVIEALVAICVFTVGVVGLSKLIGFSLRSTQSSNNNAKIVLMAENAIETIGMLSNSIDSSVAKDSFLDNADCNIYTDANDKQKCQVGVQNRSDWNSLLVKNVPNATANILRSGSDNSIEIQINWTENVLKKTSSTTTLNNTYKVYVDL